MNIWIRKDINYDRYKRSIIDGFAAIKAAFGEDFDNRDFLIAEEYQSTLSSMVESESHPYGIIVTPYTLKGAGTDSYRIPSVGYPRYVDIKYPDNPQEALCIEMYIDEILEDKDEYNTLYIKSFKKGGKEAQTLISADGYVRCDYYGRGESPDII